MARVVACLLFVAAAVTGCGEERPSRVDSATDIVRAAQRSLDQRTAGRIEFALTASAEDSEPVGFEIEGEYSFEPKRKLAVLDLTYRQVLGDESQETQIVSDGEDAWVVSDEEATKLTGEQAKSLVVGEDGAARAVPALDLGAWLRNGEVKESANGATVTGKVHASAFIADLQAIAAQVNGVAGGELDESTTEQIDRSAKASSMEIVTEKNSLHAVAARVDFGTAVPKALREALGSYAGATLELSMTVDDIRTPLQVEPPS